MCTCAPPWLFSLTSYITSLCLINIWICHLLPTSLRSDASPARIWLCIIPLSYDVLLFRYLKLWACHFLTFVIQTPRLHNLRLKVFSLLPVRRMTFFILHMLMCPNDLFHGEKWVSWTELCPLPNSYVEVLTGILVSQNMTLFRDRAFKEAIG